MIVTPVLIVVRTFFFFWGGDDSGSDIGDDGDRNWDILGIGT